MVVADLSQIDESRRLGGRAARPEEAVIERASTVRWSLYNIVTVYRQPIQPIPFNAAVNYIYNFISPSQHGSITVIKNKKIINTNKQQYWKKK